MGAYLYTNVASLSAQRNLANSQDMLKVSTERLSSGKRINSAKDHRLPIERKAEA